jgi:hypothetical protein
MPILPVLPFVAAAVSVIWMSLARAERFSVVLWALIAPLVAAIVLASSWNCITAHTHKSVRIRWANGLIGLVCAAVFVSVPLTHWPLRFAYKLSRPSFKAVARSLQSGAKFQKPMRVGLFTIEKAEIYDLNGKVCLWTDLSPSGKTGFAMCPPDDVPFNLWSMIALDGDWQFVSED